MTWTYNAASLTTVPATPSVVRDQVRFLIGDTDPASKQLEDEEIVFAISLRASTYGAAANCCRALATKAARRADSAQGPLHTALSQITRNYQSMAARYENQAIVVPGFAGGISISDKMQREMDSDRVPPNFNIGMTDNFLPVPPAGNESEDQPTDESQVL